MTQIINAFLLTMEDKNYENGYLILEDGKIKELGDMADLKKIAPDALDVHGMTVMPGLIDSHCHLGMWEDGLGFEGDDGNEETDPVTPQLRAIDAVNPMDHCFEEALSAGITTVLTGPGSANPISGSWCALKTHGRRIDDMLLDPCVGMKFSLGENPKSTYNGKNETPVTRMATASLIREQLEKAKRYMQDSKRAKKEHDDPPEFDSKCEALIPVLRRKTKAFFHAHRADDIFTAIRIAKEFKLDYVLIHCTEGYLIADILKKEQANVIAGPIICDRSKPELRNLNVKNPAVLDAHKIRTAICTDHPVIPIQYLPLSGGVSVKAGLSHEQALRMLTIVPAQICGIDRRVGSLKAGKDADLLIFNDDILNVYSSPAYVFVDGQLARRADKPTENQ